MAFDWGTLLSDAAKAVAAYASKNASSGKFTQVPEDPSLKAIRQKVLGYVDNSPTRDMVAGLIKPRLENAPGWNPPPGKYGYSIPGATPPKYDLSKLLPNLQTAPTPPAASGGAPNVGNPDMTKDMHSPGNDSPVPGGGSDPFGPGFQGPAGIGGPDSPNFQRLMQLATKYGPSILASYFGGPLGSIAYDVYKMVTKNTTLPGGPPNYPIDIMKPGDGSQQPGSSVDPQHDYISSRATNTAAGQSLGLKYFSGPAGTQPGWGQMNQGRR